MAAASSDSSSARRFGVFGGVFTPSTLTILGVIMFLRFGQVVGQAGIMQALMIIACAKLITILTALSISAIATNTRVEGGGAYFLISRSLGVEFGGAIGIVFFLAQAISVSMYVIGFTEALLNLFPAIGASPAVVASIVNLVVFICVYIGAGWTIKLQYGILAVLILSLVSFCAGVLPDFSPELVKLNSTPSYIEGANVFIIFALFFPAVTGIMAGVNMSGDLKNPARAIPLGTLLAIVVTALVYFGLAYVLGATQNRDDLIGNNFLMVDVAWSPMLVNAGIFAATLSSALGSMMGAPRILQALAKDNIFASLRTFARGSGPSAEPRRATILTFIIAEAAVLLGDLDVVAPIITMFFMVTYGTINLACFYESITNNPSYRPSFKLSHWSTALLGAAGCVGVMFLMAPVSALVAIGSMAGLHWMIRRKEVRARWGDVGSGIAFERARKALLKLEEELYHPKNWRPSILALSGGAFLRNHLAEYGHWLASGSGILSLGQVLTGPFEDPVERRLREEDKLRQFIADEELGAFPAVVISDTLASGVISLLQCHGLGGLRPNTVMLGWSGDEESETCAAYGNLLRLIKERNRSLILVNCPAEGSVRWSAPHGTIDLWWSGGQNSSMMLLLAHLLIQKRQWRGRTIRILRTVGEDADPEKAAEAIWQVIRTARVKAVPEIVVTKKGNNGNGNDNGTGDSLRKHSADAALVMAGFEPPEEGEEEAFTRETAERIAGLERVLLISCAGGISVAA